jgi:hypothetical protein
MKAITDAAIIMRITRALREFGYAGLTEAQVAEQFASVMAGERPSNIIGMFIKGWVDDALYVLEERGRRAAPDDADEDRP